MVMVSGSFGVRHFAGYPIDDVLKALELDVLITDLYALQSRVRDAELPRKLL